MTSLPRFAALAIFLGSGFLTAGELMVFAAASLTNALDEVGERYAAESGDEIRFNFAGSNQLARQIEAGAPADVFVSADEIQMDALEAKGRIVKATRCDLLGNSLVVIVAPGGPKISRLEDLAGAGVRRLSLGHPEAVPAGVYAKAHLEKTGLWKSVTAKVVPAENVRAALAFVESGNAEAGIVYKTDAATSGKVEVVWEIPTEEGPRILYPVARVADSRHAAAAGRFLTYLRGDVAAGIFMRHGFTVLEK